MYFFPGPGLFLIVLALQMSASFLFRVEICSRMQSVFSDTSFVSGVDAAPDHVLLAFVRT